MSGWHGQSTLQFQLPPTRHSQNPYTLKPVLSPQTSIRSTQTKALEKIDTAAINTIFKILKTVFDSQVTSEFLKCFTKQKYLFIATVKMKSLKSFTDEHNII